MKSAALELGAHKITVNAVIPGLIDTPLLDTASVTQQAVDDFHSKQPTGILEAEARARCAWVESDRDSRISEILIQLVGWAEASRRWQSRIGKTCVTA
jgi:NAD(P)-dependent dehydrogenase (short-subunit alcohol dehydrogenase family)